MIDEKFNELVRMKIAGKNIQKKSLARKCRVSRPQFSEMIHNDRVMPEPVRRRLILELKLEKYMERLGL